MQDLIKEVPKICLGRYILWTHVTSPVFCSKDYMDFVNFFFNQKKFKSAFSATIISTFFMDESLNWLSHNYKKKKWPRTQDLKKFYSVNNAAFISKRENYLISSDRLDGKPLPIISRKYSDIDIDNKEDFFFSKRFLKINQFQFSSDKNEKVLVTGGSGFIGAHLVQKLLNNNYKVMVVDNLKTIGGIIYINPKSKFVKGDILDQGFEKD